jgi:nucleoside-diphosphate-sugar epimerase
MPRRILLTGASGFIGKALHAHVDVIAVSRHHGIDMASEDWPRLLPDVAVDTVFHLAQSGGYRHFPEQAADMRRVNIDATAQLLEWSRLHQVGRFIFASTGNVYKPADHALAENDPTLPASFPVINARLFGVYGPGQRSMLIPDLVERLLGRQEIVLARGTGLMFTPLFIQDCVEIISALASLRLSGSSLVMNMAGDRTIGLNQVVEMLEKLLDTRALLRHTAEPAAFMVANIEKFKALFSDFALTAPEDGFRKLVAGGRHV